MDEKICFTFHIKLYIMYKSAGCGSVWLERTAGGREVAGSNPVTPIFLYLQGFCITLFVKHANLKLPYLFVLCPVDKLLFCYTIIFFWLINHKTSVFPATIITMKNWILPRHSLELPGRNKVIYLPRQPRGVLIPDPSLAERGNTYGYIWRIYDHSGCSQLNRINSEFEK